MEDSVKDRILAYIKAKNLSQKRFEQAANLSNGYVSNLRHAPSTEKVSAILSAFPDINRTWLLTGDGSMLTSDAPAPSPVPQHAVPVYDGDVTCNLSETRTYSDMPIDGYIDLPLVGKGTIVLKTHGESMVPTVNDGDYIAMRPLQSWDYIMHGNIYVVELPEYRALKRVRKGSDEAHVILRSDNDDYDDRLLYRRNKTGQRFDVKIEPEARSIINKYKGKDHILYVMDNSRDYHTFLRNMNRRIKKYVPGISSYWSRHTVASIASQLDISTDVIGRMLGHSDPAHSTTDIYINFDMRKVDAAMRRVIDYINAL